MAVDTLEAAQIDARLAELGQRRRDAIAALNMDRAEKLDAEIDAELERRSRLAAC